jgi:hypothetical protein
MPLTSYSLNSFFHKGSEYAIKIDMRALVLNLLKIVNVPHHPRKRSKRLWMSQGSILHIQNLNPGPEAKPAKNRKFLHVARKSAIGPRIMQRLILYAQNCSKLSRDPLKPCLLKISTTCCMYTSLSKCMETKSTLTLNQTTMYRSYTCLVGTNLLLTISAKLWENLRMPAKIMHAGS